jgi:DNA methyltransferase 1-associated protein 1
MVSPVNYSLSWVKTPRQSLSSKISSKKNLNGWAKRTLGTPSSLQLSSSPQPSSPLQLPYSPEDAADTGSTNTSRVWTPFKNPARSDDLTLYHWERKTESTEDSVYAFSKFNVSIDVPVPSESEYAALRSDDWTREETDYLLSICRDFDLRWSIIWDRYDYPGKTRKLEDLKARYYNVCRSLMEQRTPVAQMTPEELVAYNLTNFEKEREGTRRAMAEKQFNKTEEQVREEEMLLTELKRIVANQEKMFEERKDIFQRLNYPQSSGSIQQYQGSQGIAHLRDMLLANNDKNKKRKTIALGPSTGVETAQATPTSAVSTDRGNAPAKQERQDKSEAKRQVRKLTKEEETQYGVSQHEKLASGVKLRSTMNNSTIKGATQTKIMGALTQLGIPAKLTMCTVKTMAKMLQLESQVAVLLDTRKAIDKLEQEAKVLRAQLGLKEKEGA